MEIIGHFDRTADQAGAARSFVRDALERWGVARRVDDVVLLASELFTNAVLHGEGAVDVRLTLTDHHVRLEVVDDGASPVARRQGATTGDYGGRGLAIVEMLASAWGSDDRGRTRVWAEVPYG